MRLPIVLQNIIAKQISLPYNTALVVAVYFTSKVWTITFYGLCLWIVCLAPQRFTIHALHNPIEMSMSANRGNDTELRLYALGS